MRHLLLAVLLVLAGTRVLADTIELKLPTSSTYPYHHDLRKQALEAAGHEVILTRLSEDHSQKRLVAMLDMDSPEITLLWLVQTKERDQAYVPVNVGVTDGLIGHRILFIPKGTQPRYDGVRSLADFRKLGLTGGFGKGWFDVEVWNANGLKVFEKDGSWDPELYLMTAQGDRGVDYLSRGANEIITESPRHPELDIEKHLVLVYDRDFHYYLTKSNARLQPVIESALKKAKESGLLTRLLRKHFSDVYDKNRINLEGRRFLRLVTPK